MFGQSFLISQSVKAVVKKFTGDAELAKIVGVSTGIVAGIATVDVLGKGLIVADLAGDAVTHVVADAAVDAVTDAFADTVVDVTTDTIADTATDTMVSATTDVAADTGADSTSNIADKGTSSVNASDKSVKLGRQYMSPSQPENLGQSLNFEQGTNSFGQSSNNPGNGSGEALSNPRAWSVEEATIGADNSKVSRS